VKKKIIDIDLELEVYIYLYEICKNLQDQFPFPIQEDELRYHNISRSISAKNAIEYRLIERRIINSSAKLLIKKKTKILDNMSRSCWDYMHRRTTLPKWSLQKLEHEQRNLL